jgi:pimeloyl-ACP methyl ester carboxylesterase
MTEKKIIRMTLPGSSVADIPLHAAYLEQGCGPTLLLLHGFLGRGECWQSLMDRLTANFRCISLDLLGFGDSAKPKVCYDIALEVAFLRAVIKALQLQSYAILGHSFGGWVAAAYTLQYGAEVTYLVLAAAAGIRDDQFCGRYDHLRPLLWPSPFVDWGLSLLKPFARLLGQYSALEQLCWIRRELQTEPAACSFLLERLRPEDAIDTVEQDIHRIQTPTLVITGDRDETIPLWHSQTYAQEIPNAQLVIIPDANHALPQDYALQLADSILKFTRYTL